MTTENFYRDLPRLSRFDLITDPRSFQPLPDEWLILLTDVRGSTKAIEEGRYKDVNLVGASTIMAVLNALGELEVPFVFGGDGATLVVPPSCGAKCRAALAASAQLAREAFGLELRAGVVSVGRVRQDGFPVEVAKIQVSPNYDQASFGGGGLARAEKLVKDPSSNAEFLVPASKEAGGNFEGLECRWSDIRVPRQEILSLLVLARGDDARETYARVLRQIGEVFGDVEGLRPIERQNLRVTLSPLRLWKEAKIRCTGQGPRAKLKYLALAWLENLYGLWAMRARANPAPPPPDGTDWANYRQEVLKNTDSRKFDDALRMILGASAEQRARLEKLLERERAAGKLHYGLHAASHALMTCLVFDGRGRHVHFVDGGDGGYAAAAVQLKAQMRE